MSSTSCNFGGVKRGGGGGRGGGGLLFVVMVMLWRFGDTMAASQRNGMAVAPFQGIPNILEVSCSGEALEADSEVFVMALLQRRTKKMMTPTSSITTTNKNNNSSTRIALVNVMSGECSTSGSFSSCRLFKGDSRRTLLRTLVMGLEPGETRTYSCQVTFLRSGDSSPRSSEWRLDVRGTPD
ncbi:uncharacterized protein LOC143291542 [Babylonia areolata]|uniref:uncharacterized protein LOC143291542 n=1 Tax=Babylonia areolata TaxID=304850 RepID=UPI003FD61DE9